MTNEQSGIHDCCDRCIGPGGAGVFAGGVRRAGGSRISTGRIGHSHQGRLQSRPEQGGHRSIRPVHRAFGPSGRDSVSNGVSTRDRRSVPPDRLPDRPSDSNLLRTYAAYGGPGSSLALTEPRAEHKSSQSHGRYTDEELHTCHRGRRRGFTRRNRSDDNRIRRTDQRVVSTPPSINCGRTAIGSS